MLAVSASGIRHDLRERQVAPSATAVVPAVAEYIERHGLYRASEE